jgi:hypothetical protein
MEDSVPFASREFFLFLLVLLFSRGMDFLSTWVATPHLVLEGNPIAKKLGWRWGAVVNLAICVSFALYPVAAVIVATTSVLVAARNFQSAWVMRTMGEFAYRDWYVARYQETRPTVYLFCLFGQTSLVALVGLALVFAAESWFTQAVGMGIIGYAMAVTFYTLLSVWRMRRNSRYIRPTDDNANADPR